MEPADDAIRDRIERLKTVRQRLGWSEEHCAHQLGVTYSTWSRWERGEALPRSQAIVQAIDAFLASHEEGAGP